MFLLWLHCLFLFSLKFNCLQRVFLNEKIDDNCWNIDHVLQTMWKLTSHTRAGRHECQLYFTYSHIHFLSLIVLPTLPLSSSTVFLSNSPPPTPTPFHNRYSPGDSPGDIFPVVWQWTGFHFLVRYSFRWHHYRDWRAERGGDRPQDNCDSHTRSTCLSKVKRTHNYTSPWSVLYSILCQTLVY